VPAACCV